MRPVQHIGNVVFFDTLFIVLVLRFESGDQMLQAVALAMQELFGRKRCYRIGGDEFVAVLRNRQIARWRTVRRCWKRFWPGEGIRWRSALRTRGSKNWTSTNCSNWPKSGCMPRKMNTTVRQNARNGEQSLSEPDRLF